MGDPKDRLPPDGTNDLSIFDTLTPSSDGTPRNAESVFPAQVDSFPVLEDGVDEKVFAQYMHQVYVSVINTQEWVKGILQESLHTHEEMKVEYNGDNEVVTGFTFVPGSTEVYLRGRKLIKGIHYSEGAAFGSVTLTLTSPEGAEVGDLVEVKASVASTNIADSHIHETYNEEYSSDSIIFLTTEIFRPGSTEVYLRGRKLIKDTHYEERADLKGIELTLSAPEGAEAGDLVEVGYTVAS